MRLETELMSAEVKTKALVEAKARGSAGARRRLALLTKLARVQRLRGGLKAVRLEGCATWRLRGRRRGGGMVATWRRHADTRRYLLAAVG